MKWKLRHILAKNIVLIGMPGAGKSTVGVVLAKKLGYSFIDSDLLIQERNGKLLHEIISKQGIEGFLKIENEINLSIDGQDKVIATGGSAVYGKEAMEHFARTAYIVYLKLPYEEIKERLGDLNKRGVVIREGETLKSLYEERTSLYEKYSMVTIEAKGKAIREIIEEIAEKVQEK